MVEFWACTTFSRIYGTRTNVGTAVVPRYLMLFSASGELVHKSFVDRLGPLEPDDFKPHIDRIPASSTVCCLAYIGDVVRGAVGKKGVVVVKEAEHQMPDCVRGHFLRQRSIFIFTPFSPCAKCGDTGVLHIGRGWGSLPCCCQGLMSLQGVTPEMVRAFYQASQEFWLCDPVKKFGLNHVFRLEMAGSPLKYFQVVCDGSESSSDALVVAHEHWSQVRSQAVNPNLAASADSSWIVELSAALYPVQELVDDQAICWADFDYIEEQQRNNTPLPMPDARYSDPLAQRELPCCIKKLMRLGPDGQPAAPTKRTRHTVLPSSSELAYLTAAMHAMTTLVRTKALRTAPGDPFLRPYYAFSREIELPAGGGTATLHFPALDDTTQMDSIQRRSFVHEGGEPEPMRLPGFRGPVVGERRNQSDVAALRAQGNAAYAAGDYLGAFDRYGDAMQLLAQLMYDRDQRGELPSPDNLMEGVIEMINLRSNYSQAGLKLEMYDTVATTCSEVLKDELAFRLTLPVEVWRKYIARCLHARARALEALGKPKEGLRDWKQLLALELHGAVGLTSAQAQLEIDRLRAKAKGRK